MKQHQSISLFKTIIDTNLDDVPFVLIDRSASTSDKCRNKKFIGISNNSNNDSEYGSEYDSEDDNANTYEYITILRRELEICEEILTANNIKQCNLMFWNSDVVNLGIVNVNEVISSLNQIKPSGGTQVVPALIDILKLIDNNDDINTKKKIDIYLFTDGEISDNSSDVTLHIKNMFNRGIRLFINTVNANSKNYLLSNESSGNELYKCINQNELVRHIKYFRMYNNNHLNGFDNLLNLDVEDKYIPYQYKCFHIDNLRDFIIFIEGEIHNIMAGEETLINGSWTDEAIGRLNVDPIGKLMKLSFDLSSSLFYILKYKGAHLKVGIIKLFYRLFENTPIYSSVKELFTTGINNQESGKGQTFQEYRKNREQVFADAQMALYENTKKSITLADNASYMSFILDDKYIIESNEHQVCGNVFFNDKIYQHAAFTLKNHSIPVLPINVTMDIDTKDQCVRQWIRAVYSKKYNIHPAADDIMYYFLTDCLRVNLSDVPEHIKEAYKNIGRIMLDRVRYGTTVKEINYLKAGNKPASVSNLGKNIDTILQECVNIFKLNVQKYTLWYGIMTLYELEKEQEIHCLSDLQIDNMVSCNVLERLSISNKLEYYDYREQQCDYEYLCYITLDDTTNVGGYIIPPHNITANIICRPTFVINSSVLATLSNIKCPYCNTSINKNLLKLISPKVNDYGNGNNTHIDLKLIEPTLDANNFRTISFKLNADDQAENKLIKMNDCNFNRMAYKIDIPYLRDELTTREIEVTTQQDFNHEVYTRYPFLEVIKDVDNICLAGGFCRSILLKQQLKDFDFFITGANPEKTFLDVLPKILNSVKSFSNGGKYKENEIKFLTMFKPQFNVYEIICMYDPQDFLKDDFNLKNFEYYNFKSLQRYDQSTLIDPESGKIFKKKLKTDTNHRYDWEELERDTNEILNIPQYIEMKIKELDNYVDKRTVKLIKNTDIDGEVTTQQLTGDALEEYKKQILREKKNELNEKYNMNLESLDLSNYFEDGDIHRIRMLHRFQFILVKFNSIEDIFESFDMAPCKVAFDGTTTYFTKKSEEAYNYMINIFDESKYSILSNHRLLKYLTYGFSVGLPFLDTNKLLTSATSKYKKERREYIFDKDFKFKVSKIDNNLITIKHNSHIGDKLNRLQAIEEKNINEGNKPLYKSQLFCSLISILRYIKINNINYKFNKNVYVPDNLVFESLDTKENIAFIDKLNTRIFDHNWYGEYRI